MNLWDHHLGREITKHPRSTFMHLPITTLFLPKESQHSDFNSIDSFAFQFYKKVITTYGFFYTKISLRDSFIVCDSTPEISKLQPRKAKFVFVKYLFVYILHMAGSSATSAGLSSCHSQCMTHQA